MLQSCLCRKPHLLALPHPQAPNSHEVPVQILPLHIPHEVHQAPLEEDLEAQVILEDQRFLQSLLHDLRENRASSA